MTATVYQSQSQAYVAYKVQSGKGSQASGSSAFVLPVTGGQGGQMTKAAIQSNVVQRDMQMLRGRHGSQKTTGSWNNEISLGSHDAILEAIMRGTWANGYTITQATSAMASATLGVSGNVVTFSAGNAITAGVRVGDVHRWTSALDAADRNKNLRVTAVTATTITYAEDLTTVGGGVSSYSFGAPGKRLINPAQPDLVARYFTVEEAMAEITQSEVMTDFVWSNAKFTMAPNGIITCDPGGLGTGQLDMIDTGDWPLFTSPSEFTHPSFAVVDAAIRLGTEDLVDLTSFDLTLDIGGNAPDTFGSPGQKFSPAVFTGQMGINLNITALRKDLAYLAKYIDEEVLTFHCLAAENESEPKDFLSMALTNFTLGGVAKSAISKDGGPMTEQLTVPVALVGKDSSGGAFDPTMIKFQSTAS